VEGLVKIIPERVTIVADVQKNELSIIMEGFRLTFSAEEARTLSYALVQGLKQLPEGARPMMSQASSSLPNKPPPNSPAQDAANSKLAEAGTDGMRSLSA
jgi:hypothetical protein